MTALPSPGRTVIRMREYTFSWPARYLPGHPLTINEAHALNQLVAENVRNNVAPRLAQAIARNGGGILSAVEQSELQREIELYAGGYDFGPAKRVVTRLGPIDREARRRAVEIAIARGFSPEQPEWDSIVEDFAASVSVQREARAAVAALSDAASGASLEDLL